MGSSPSRPLPSSEKNLYLCVSLHHEYFLVTLTAAHQCHCPLRDCHFSAEEQEFFISEEHAMLWLGTEYNTMEVGKTAIGRLLPLQNVTCTPNPTAKLRKLLCIFNILGWS